MKHTILLISAIFLCSCSLKEIFLSQQDVDKDIHVASSNLKPEYISSTQQEMFAVELGLVRQYESLKGKLFYFHPEKKETEDGDLNYITGLWQTDGSKEGTKLIKKFACKNVQDIPDFLTVVGEYLYFAGYDEEHGKELWKTDGTSAGTLLVKDINPGVESSNPFNLTQVGVDLYFAAFTKNAGNEPWVSNGTEDGTYMLADLNPGITNSNPQEFIKYNGKIYFVGIHQMLLFLNFFEYDLDKQKLTLIKTLQNDLVNQKFFLRVVNNKIYFTANYKANQRVLWSSNGPAESTVPIVDTSKSIYYVAKFNVFDNKIYFLADIGDTNGKNMYLYAYDTNSAILQNLSTLYIQNPVLLNVMYSKLLDSNINRTRMLKLNDDEIIFLGDTSETPFESVTNFSNITSYNMKTNVLKTLFEVDDSSIIDVKRYKDKLIFALHIIPKQYTNIKEKIELYYADLANNEFKCLYRLNKNGSSNPVNLKILSDKLFFYAVDDANTYFKLFVIDLTKL